MIFNQSLIKHNKEITMKRMHLYGILIIVVLSLTSVLVLLAQDTPPEPTVFVLPEDMETVLVPCGEDVTGPCDLIATSVEDVVGVWAQYMIFPGNSNPGSLVYLRFNTDGTFVAADSIEHTAQPTEPYPSGTYRFEDGYLIFDAIPTLPAPCNGAGIFQARVLKYGAEPVALRYVPISDACTPRLQDLIQAAVWVAP
jgi:hypothetical protein